MECITTEEITFRCFDMETDLAAYHGWVSELISLRLSRPSLYFPTVAELLHHVDNFVLTHPWFRIICIPGGIAAGFIHIAPDSDCGSQLTFAVHPVHRGRGIATAAVTKAMTTWLAQKPLQQWVDAMVCDGNHVATRVLEKVGFRGVEVRTVFVVTSVLDLTIAARDIVTLRYPRF